MYLISQRKNEKNNYLMTFNNIRDVIFISMNICYLSKSAIINIYILYIFFLIIIIRLNNSPLTNLFQI